MGSGPFGPHWVPCVPERDRCGFLCHNQLPFPLTLMLLCCTLPWVLQWLLPGLLTCQLTAAFSSQLQPLSLRLWGSVSQGFCQGIFLLLFPHCCACAADRMALHVPTPVLLTQVLMGSNCCWHEIRPSTPPLSQPCGRRSDETQYCAHTKLHRRPGMQYLAPAVCASVTSNSSLEWLNLRRLHAGPDGKLWC